MGFEDIVPLGNSDHDYNDHQFVFTNVSVPEGGMTIAMLGMACASLGLLRRKF